MGLFFVVLIFYSAFFTAVNCDHDHYSHHNKIIWHTILSALGIDWKNHTVTHTTESISASLQTNSDYHHSEYSTTDFEAVASTPILQNVPTENHMATGFKVTMALMITMPLVAIVIMCACILIICKCCKCCRTEENIIVMPNNQGTVVAPPPTQVVIDNQQYPPPYDMLPTAGWNVFPPVHNQQWNAMQEQPPPQYPSQHEPHAYTNPNFSPPYNPEYSSPPKY